jgi:membrane protease YdiL (CAAX protease family)
MNDDIAAKSYLDWSDKGKACFWRYAVGTVLMVFIFFMLSGMLLIPYTLLVPDYAQSLPLSIIAKLLVFALSFLLIPLIVRLLHKRPWWSVAMPELRFKAWDFFTGLWVACAVTAVTALLFNATETMPILSNPNFNLQTLLLVAVIGLIGIFIQAGAEELLFRGYLTQFVRRFSSNKFFFLGIPAVLFSAPHISNIAAFGGSPLVMAPYIISGLLYGWAAYRSGSLWMSVALHLVNNFSGMVFIGTLGDVLPSAAPYQVQIPSLAITTLVILLQSLATVGILSYILKRAKR